MTQDHNQDPPHFDLLFSWIEQTEEGNQFLSDSIAGNVTVSNTRHIARRFGVPLGLLWSIVLACYQGSGYLGVFKEPDH